MLKEKMVTRSFTTTEVKVLAVTVSTAETSMDNWSIVGKYEKEADLLKALKKNYENDDYKIVSIMSVAEYEKLYGMPENEFLQFAVELNPETRKPW